MALVSGSPEMSLLVRNRVGSNPTLIIIVFGNRQSILHRFESVGCFAGNQILFAAGNFAGWSGGFELGGDRV
jgi:hypothetical protein